MPRNWRALAGFRRALRWIWFTCLKRRSQRSRRAGWDWFEAVTARYQLPRCGSLVPRPSSVYGACDLREEPSVGNMLGCESQAAWPSYSTVNVAGSAA